MNPPKRMGVRMAKWSVRLTDAMIAELDEEARRRNLPRTQVIRERLAKPGAPKKAGEAEQ